MTHTIHQFCKEFRYLRLRWCVFLAVLGLDLAVQMEWVLPMRAVESNYNAGVFVYYEILMMVLLWMVVWWFMLSVPPEEGASGGRGYALTRPLSRVSYWAARLLVWVLLVMVPLMLECAVYLWLNGRPWSDVVLGMAERAWAVGSMTLWLLPLPLLLRGWERYAVIVLVVFTLDRLSGQVLWVVFKMLHLVYDAPQVGMEFGRSVQAAWLVGLLMPVLVVWHQRRPFGRVVRMCAAAGLLLLYQGVAASALFTNAYEKPRDQELIGKLTAGREVVLPEPSWRFQQEKEESGGDYISLRAHARLDGMPEEFVANWWDTSITMMQHGGVLPPPPARDVLRKRAHTLGALCQFMPMARALPGPKAPGLLSVDVDPGMQNLYLNLSQPAKLDEPVTASLNLTADWMRLRKLGEMPLRAGAKFLAPDFGVEVLEVMPNMSGRGERSNGCVTIVYRMSARCFEWGHALLPLFPHPYILSAKNRLMWQYMVSAGYGQSRGVNLGWCHMIQHQTFQRVLEPGTGVTLENLHEQTLMWQKPEYLGSSQHHAELKDLKIGDHLMKRDGWTRSEPAIDAGNPREAFLKQVKGIPQPTENAAHDEMARYVAEVYQAALVFGDRHGRLNDGVPKWPGNDREVHLLMVPWFVKHPELFRAALVHGDEEFTKGVVHEALLQAGIPGITRSADTGEPRYERQVPVAGKSGQVKTRVMDRMWLASYSPDILEAYIAAIQQHSDEPLWPILEEKLRSTDEVLEDYGRTFDCGELRWLMKRPDSKYRDKAEKLTREAFAHLPAVVSVQRAYEPRLQSAAALGMPEALDWLLRRVALMDAENAGSALMQHNAMFAFLGVKRPDFKTLERFIRDARRYSAKDYRYHADRMIWELLPDRP